MAEYEAAPPVQFPSAEAVGMKRAREDGLDEAAHAGQQQAGGPWPGYPGENVYRLVVPVNRVRMDAKSAPFGFFWVCLTAYYWLLR